MFDGRTSVPTCAWDAASVADVDVERAGGGRRRKDYGPVVCGGTAKVRGLGEGTGKMDGIDLRGAPTRRATRSTSASAAYRLRSSVLKLACSVPLTVDGHLAAIHDVTVLVPHPHGQHAAPDRHPMMDEIL